MPNRKTRHGGTERTIANAERDAHCARLRAQGKTYQQIADEVGYADRSNARLAVQRALLATVQEAGDELRSLELERLNMLLDRAWQVMDTPHYAHSAGRLITIDGQPLVDDGPTLAAMDRILKVMERRAKLLGLDAPARLEVLTIDAIDAEIARLDAEHASLVREPSLGEAAAAEGSEGTATAG